MTSTALAYVSNAERAIIKADTIPQITDLVAKAKAFREYMRDVGIDLEAGNSIGRIQIEAECKGSRILSSMGLKGTKNRKKLDLGSTSLKNLGVTWEQSTRWHKEDAVTNREDYYTACDADGVEVSAAGLLRSAKDGVFTSLLDTWNTPPHVIDAVIAALGAIDLDPCCNDGDPNVPAAAHYRQCDNGLAKSWVGRVYMNPPYGRAIVDWVEKLTAEYEAGNTTGAVALLPSRTDTVWFRMLAGYPRCFVNGRLHFSGSETPAPFPSMCVYLGDRRDDFTAAFLAIGDTYERI